MKRTRKWIARFVALAALAAAVIAVIVVASNTDLHSNSHDKGRQTVQKETQKKPRTKAKKYVVQSGDTLTSIAAKTGIPVAEIMALNPEVDPQILIAGETLKLQK